MATDPGAVGASARLGWARWAFVAVRENTPGAAVAAVRGGSRMETALALPFPSVSLLCGCSQRVLTA